MVVVFSEDAFVDRNTINGRELQSLAETARLLGCRVYSIPSDFAVCDTAENALAYVPVYDPVIPGIWVGYIPSVERYTALYDSALTKGIRLVNTSLEYQTAMEFDRFYPLLRELTPESITLTDLQDLAEIETRLGYPVFIKGAVKSNKEQGWNACVAHNLQEATTIAQDLLARERRSRGRIVVRKLVRFRTVAADSQDFPMGREYRLFVYRDEVLAYGFYWDQILDSQPLTTQEEHTIKALALEAARRVGTPFITVDIGQLENGQWVVIEVGDGQFSGLSQTPILELWNRLVNLSV